MKDQLGQIEFARLRRQIADEYERLMWQLLRNRQRRGMKFRREQPLGCYTADFFCAEVKLVVEIDGSSHDSGEAKLYDSNRDRWMNSRGIKVIRFSCSDVFNDPESVIDEIDQVLDQLLSLPLTPNPSPARGEGSQGDLS